MCRPYVSPLRSNETRQIAVRRFVIVTRLHAFRAPRSSIRNPNLGRRRLRPPLRAWKRAGWRPHFNSPVSSTSVHLAPPSGIWMVKVACDGAKLPYTTR